MPFSSRIPVAPSRAGPRRVPRWLTLCAAAYGFAVLSIVVSASAFGTSRVFGFVGLVPFGDKLGHFLLIGNLAMLFDLALGRRDLRAFTLRVPLAPTIVVVLVALEELSQRWFPGRRTFDLLDLGADVLGVIAFVLAARLLASRARGHSRSMH
jgi:polysaccharide biosynthesis protein VpsQ